MATEQYLKKIMLQELDNFYSFYEELDELNSKYLESTEVAEWAKMCDNDEATLDQVQDWNKKLQYLISVEQKAVEEIENQEYDLEEWGDTLVRRPVYY